MKKRNRPRAVKSFRLSAESVSAIRWLKKETRARSFGAVVEAAVKRYERETVQAGG